MRDMASRAIEPRYRSGPPVGPSEDLQRIIEIPRRNLDLNDPIAAQLWTKHLRRVRTEPCECVARWGFCITDLRTVQGWALENAMDSRGLLASIGVGDGKTGIDILLPMAIPGVRVAVLILQANLRTQFLTRDYPQWAAHFRVPNLAGGAGSFQAGLPMLHVVSYNDVSSPKNSDLFRRINPDLIIGDEAQNLKDPTTARTGRFLRMFADKPSTMFAALSGTLTTKSIKDYAHLSALSLRDASPVPFHPPTVDEWSAAIDAESSANPYPNKPGALLSLCGPAEATISDETERARAGFRRRFQETLGVIATRETDLKVSLVLAERKPPATPQNVRDAMRLVENESQRPDGEELQTGLEISAVMRRLSAGFYYRWRFPRGETPETIELWRARRKSWRKEVRDTLKGNAENLDSPSLLEHAAERWHLGYVSPDATYPPKTRGGPRLTFESIHWPNWAAVKGTVEPQTEAVWLSEWLAADAAKWAAEQVGIVWFQHDAFAKAVVIEARKLGLKLPHYGGGKLASLEILAEKGDRSILASMKAHGTGKNLQMFSRALIANPPSASDAWEQVIGRIHRTGQKASEVTIDVYRHSEEYRTAIRQAQARARYVEQTTGSRQRLAFAAIEWEETEPAIQWSEKLETGLDAESGED